MDITKYLHIFAGPALVVVVRGVDAFRHLESIFCPSQPPSDKSERSLERVMSPTPEVAFWLVTLFFGDDELFADDEARPLLLYLPPVSLSKATHDQVVSIFSRPPQ